MYVNGCFGVFVYTVFIVQCVSLCVFVSVVLYMFRVMQEHLRMELQENEASLQAVTALTTVYYVLLLKRRRYSNVTYAGYDCVRGGS